LACPEPDHCSRNGTSGGSGGWAAAAEKASRAANKARAAVKLRSKAIFFMLFLASHQINNLISPYRLQSDDSLPPFT
jgi:hypothetical protein